MSTLLPNTPDLEPHFKALNVGSLAAYKLWCYRNGLDTSTQKSPDQLQIERDLYQSQNPDKAPDVHARHDPTLAKHVVRIFKGGLQNANLSHVLHNIRTMYNRLNGRPEVQQALGRLTLHIEKYGDLIRPIRATKSYGNSTDNTYLGGMRQLAQHHKNWIRPVEEWRPKNHKARLQFNALARHLLARYEVPPFFDKAFFQGDTEEAHSQQKWFIHIGKGQNIRTAGVPMRLTKRMAHNLIQGNDHRLTVYQAMRTAQYNALKTAPQTWHTSWIIAHGPLGDSLANDNFWETVVQFIGNQNFLARSYVDAIVDYIRHQKFAPSRIPQPDGTVIEGPPVHPNFCMKGRSANKLLRQVDEWHQELTGMEGVELETWAPSGLREFEHTVVDPELNRNILWSVHELTTSQQLYAEGRIMRHCVGSYTQECAEGEKSVWSLRALDTDAAGENQIQEHVLTIEVNVRKRAVVQFAGKCNLKPHGRQHTARQRHADSIYLHLLRQSPTFLRTWMEREGLSRG